VDLLVYLAREYEPLVSELPISLAKMRVSVFGQLHGFLCQEPAAFAPFGVRQLLPFIGCEIAFQRFPLHAANG
jgi:hypothetical protein